VWRGLQSQRSAKKAGRSRGRHCRLRIREIAQIRVRYGYRKIRVLLNREGWKVGTKLVYRLYREEGLTLRHKPRRKRRASQHRHERVTGKGDRSGTSNLDDPVHESRRAGRPQEQPNQTYDFVLSEGA
jgi:hypothetical protein